MPEWSWSELVESFSALSQQAGDSPNSIRIALLIDGLDEFGGDYNTIIDFVKLLHSCPGIKICISSRPWNVFHDAFDTNPSLRMEILTGKDINTFVRTEFATTKGYQEVHGHNPFQAEKLIHDIVTKAQGVFLWVSIITRLLCVGLTDGTRISDLQAVLDSLPDDL